MTLHFKRKKKYRLLKLFSRKAKTQTTILCLFFCAMLFLSSMMTAFAWNDFTQYKTNVFRGTTNAVEVVLHKVEKDANGVIQANPVTPVVNAEFQLYRVESDNSETLLEGGPWYTDASGKIVLDSRDSRHTKLPVGRYYFLETSPSYGYSYDKDSDGKDITRYDFEITQTDALSDAVITIAAYNRRGNGTLEVTKTVQGEAPADDKFTFRISFSNGRTDYQYKIYYADGTYSDYHSLVGENKDTFILKDGESAVFDAVPIGLGYNVQEIYQPDYYTTSQNSQGTIPHPGENGEQRAVAAFTNTYHGAGETGNLTVSKTISGTLANAEDTFTFRVVFSDGGTYEYEKHGQIFTFKSGETFTLKGGESVVFKDLPVGLQYTVNEEANHLGYTASVTNMSGTIVSAGVTAAFENNKEEEAEPGSLEIEKTVTGTDRTDSFTFKVTFAEKTEWSYSIYNMNAANNAVSTKMGEGTEVTLTLTKDQKAFFYPLPAGLHYTVQEIDIPENYIPSATKQEGQIPSACCAYAPFNNHYDTPEEKQNTELIISKKVIGEIPDSLKDTVFRFTVTIEGEENTIPVELKAGHTSDSISLPVGTAYTVTELDSSKDGFTCVSTAYASGTAGENEVLIEFTNQYVGPVCITVNGVKEWKAPEGSSLPASLPASVIINLIDINSGQVVSTAVADKDNGYKFSFYVPKYDAEGKEIQYTVQEAEVVGYQSSVTGDQVNGFTVTNTYKPDATNWTQLTVQKVWDDIGNEDKRPTEIQVQLYKDGAAEGPPILLNNDNNWTVTITELEEGAGYTVKEVSVPENYTSAVKKSDNGYVITNTYNSGSTPGGYNELITIGGVNIWEDNNNADGKRPDSITLHVMNGDQVIKTITVTEKENWSWSLANLPKYDENGKRIVYTIKVDPVEYYSTFIEGFNITNTYKSGEGSPGGDTPQTGDATNLKLWFGLMIVSAIALWITVGTRPRGRNKKKTIHPIK